MRLPWSLAMISTRSCKHEEEEEEEGQEEGGQHDAGGEGRVPCKGDMRKEGEGRGGQGLQHSHSAIRPRTNRWCPGRCRWRGLLFGTAWFLARSERVSSVLCAGRAVGSLGGAIGECWYAGRDWQSFCVLLCCGGAGCSVYRRRSESLEASRPLQKPPDGSILRAPPPSQESHAGSQAGFSIAPGCHHGDRSCREPLAADLLRKPPEAEGPRGDEGALKLAACGLLAIIALWFTSTLLSLHP